MDYVWLTDAAERVLWTLIQVALASAIVWLGDFDGVWVVPLATLLAGIKAGVVWADCSAGAGDQHCDERLWGTDP